MIPVIFINCEDQPYVDEIMSGKKTYETRSKNTLKALLSWALGERVLIAETGHGAPVVRCSAVIDHLGAVYTKDRWDSLRKAHRVPKGSKYDWKPDTKVKWMYHLSDVQPVEPFTPTGTRHGRVWMEYNGTCQDRSEEAEFARFKGRSGIDIIIYRYGPNDYSVWFTDDPDNDTSGCSVRGTLQEITDEIADELPARKIFDQN